MSSWVWEYCNNAPRKAVIDTTLCASYRRVYIWLYSTYRSGKNYIRSCTKTDSQINLRDLRDILHIDFDILLGPIQILGIIINRNRCWYIAHWKLTLVCFSTILVSTRGYTWMVFCIHTCIYILLGLV